MNLDPYLQAEADEDPRCVVIEPMTRRFSLGLNELCHYRYLLQMLVLRDVTVRYKQTMIGIGWAIIQPLLSTAVLTMVFSRFAGVSTEGVAYPVFALAALLPWNYFNTALGRCVTSLVGSAHLISRVYFPRLLIPMTSIIVPLADFVAALALLIGLMGWYRTEITWRMLAMPWFLGMAAFTALAVGLWLSALNVRYRDVGHAVPFFLQIAMYCSPIAYPTSLVPERWRLLYQLNPVTGVIEGFRWSILGLDAPRPAILAFHVTLVTLLFLGGLAYFRRTEAILVDLV